MALKVLVVDDNTLTADSLAKAITSPELEVEVFYSGQDCLNRVKKDPPVDFIILDMNMPGVNGAQVLTEFSKLDPKPKVKVILFTAYADWQSDLMEKTLGGTLRWSNGTVVGDPMADKGPFADFLIGELDKSSGFQILVQQIKELITANSKK